VEKGRREGGRGGLPCLVSPPAEAGEVVLLLLPPFEKRRGGKVLFQLPSSKGMEDVQRGGPPPAGRRWLTDLDDEVERERREIRHHQS